jgi:hypothetical protein
MAGTSDAQLLATLKTVNRERRMLARTRNGFRLTAIAALTMALQVHTVCAENRLTLNKDADNRISIDLYNTDAIAGFQFSVNGRGGLTFGEYQGSVRIDAAGLGVYQYLKDDSTLNIVILAPAYAALPSGNGVIGRISFSLSDIVRADTARVFLSKVVLCNAKAQYLNFTTSNAEWAMRASEGTTQRQFALEQNFPNPFNPSTTITYTLDRPAAVRLAVYDITGRQIETLVDQSQREGRYSVKWNADSRRGLRLASGMYFARLQVEDQVAVQKMTLAK